MSVNVQDAGFRADDHDGTGVLDIAGETPADALPGSFDDVDLIRIIFAAYADGRGFTLARALRGRGYRGRLRAVGPLIADQYAMARRSGFDEVEIPDEIAARQPEEQWLFRANWRAHDYRSRLSA